VIGVLDGFSFDSTFVHGRKYPAECVTGVVDDFQPYARAFTYALELTDWKSEREDRNAKLRKIVKQFVHRDEQASCLAARIERERNWIATQEPELLGAQGKQTGKDMAQGTDHWMLPLAAIATAVIAIGALGICKSR
jgi:hypothetical protein